MKGEKEGRGGEGRGKVDIGKSETRGCVDRCFVLTSLTSVCLLIGKNLSVQAGKDDILLMSMCLFWTATIAVQLFRFQPDC